MNFPVFSQLAVRGLAGLRSLLAQQQEASDLGDFERFYILDEALHAEFCILAGRKGCLSRQATGCSRHTTLLTF
jgi:DNA-binding GntR family transcriptional regulator